MKQLLLVQYTCQLQSHFPFAFMTLSPCSKFALIHTVLLLFED